MERRKIMRRERKGRKEGKLGGRREEL